jgi:IS30 family transposase
MLAASKTGQYGVDGGVAAFARDEHRDLFFRWAVLIGLAAALTRRAGHAGAFAFAGFENKLMRGRKPKGCERCSKLCDINNINERPGEVEGRLVLGHWEGDFIPDAKGSSAIGTLVERTTRFVVLVKVPTRKADVATSAFAGALNAIPAPLRKTLTYDQGKEMAAHSRLAPETGMRTFFADPHSPWQRGSNENTNRLLR